MIVRAAFLALLCLGSLCSGLAAETYALKKVLIADDPAKAMALPATSGRDAIVFTQDIPLLDAADFPEVVRPFAGRTIDQALLGELTTAITNYVQAQDRLIVSLQLPTPQDISDGVVRFVLVIGQINQLTVQGNRWFSRELLEQKLGIKPGDEVRLSTIEDAVTWANTNPFRHVQALINPIPGQPGKADLLINVQERRPYRFAASYDDSGVAVVGRNHYTGSVQFGNLWGLDHQSSYQYVTTDKRDLYQVHAFDYRVPLRWRHFLHLNAAYVLVKPTLFGGFGSQRGENFTSTLRYTVPVRGGVSPIELFGGIDFKSSNNDVEFFGQNAFRARTHTFQAAFGGSVVQRDSKGAWLFAANIYASPGNLTSRNSDATYHSARFGSSSRYVYGTLSVQRLLTLHKGWELVSRGTLQFSGGNLLGNEQLAIGGPSTVRGYDTNVFTGDEGYVFNNDLQSPTWRKKFARWDKLPPLETRLLVFFDAGHVSYKKPIGTDPVVAALASVGLGARVTLPSNFSLNFDYGWRLTRMSNRPQEAGRGHIKAVLAF